ncbi:MAG: hypothetical protein NC429_07875 [Lachnospiraceae bacterium]|nr:hypothetical protein [Lachnospiraceae bacterium]
MKKKLPLPAKLAIGILLCLTLAGCADKGGRYEGAGMSFQYDPSAWSIFYREADEDNRVIELYSDKGAGLSIVACESNVESAEEIYQGMITADQILGQVSGMAAQNNMSEEGGTASYAHRTKTNFSSDYWTLFFGKNLGDGKVMLAAATIYITEEEEADQSRQEIEKMIASLKVSDQTDTGEITKALVDPDVQTNVLVNYLNGGQKVYSYMEGSQAAQAEPVSLEGFEYVEMVTLTDGVSKQEVNVYVPIGKDRHLSDDNVYYYEHGLDFSLFLIGEWLYISPEEQISTWMQMEIDDVSDNAARYQNLVVDDMVTVEEGLCCYQHMSVDELDTREIATTNHGLVYAGTAPNGIGYLFTLGVTASWTDSETNAILEELGKCYNLDLSEYGTSNEDLTNAGTRVDMAQDNYVQKSDEPEIQFLDGYTYMGVTEMTDYDDNIYELWIPMGRNTSNRGSSLSANMHGVSVSIYPSYTYGGETLMESVQKTIQNRYDSMAENSRDYKDLSMGDPQMTTEGEGVYSSATAGEHINYDGKSFPYHEIYYELRLQGRNILTMTIRLDEYSYDAYTNVLLEELEQVYRMDLSDFYYND